MASAFTSTTKPNLTRGGTARTDFKVDPPKVQVGSALSVKQRIAESTVLINPRERKASKASPVVGSATTTAQSLRNLSFKKNNTVNSRSEAVEADKVASPIAGSPLARQDSRPVASSSAGATQGNYTNTATVRSPSPMLVDPHEGPAGDLILPPSFR